MHPTPLEELSPQQVVARYADMVYRLLYAQLCNPYDAQDAFQEVFLAYMQKAPVFASEEHRKAWLIRVSINQCKTFWRRAKREKRLPAGAPEQAPQEPFFPLLEALGALNPKQRALIHLFYFEGYSTGEIAKMLNKSQGAVRTGLTRARKALAQLYEGELDDAKRPIHPMV